jgi:hypothetical protein
MIGAFGRVGLRVRPGDYLVQCDHSGFKSLASECVIDPESGGFVRAEFADKENPQKYLRVKREDRSVPIARPWGLDSFVDTSLPPDMSVL